MWPESAETDKPLRTGLTTGTCATACCVAASELLLGRSSTNQITVTLPKGQEVSLVVDSCQKADDVVRASTVKDAGDDPDITHGARIFVELALRDASGVAFVAGPGVGTVTRKGLALAVGEYQLHLVALFFQFVADFGQFVAEFPGMTQDIGRFTASDTAAE